MRECKQCHTTKPFTEFYKRPLDIEGYSSYCKKCSKERYHNKYYNNKKDEYKSRA